ncbi:MAG: hypothetical protein ACRCVT_02180, partial [Leadbetterella sp.]
MIFPRSVLLPYDTKKGKALPTGRVKFSLDQAKFTKSEGMGGMLVSISASSLEGGPFCIPKFEKFGFKLEEATYDGSDLSNSPSMTFPDGYNGDMSPGWKGIYIKNFEVYLPKSFRKDNQDAAEGEPAINNTNVDAEKIECVRSIGGKGILIDGTGFTGIVYFSNDCQGEYSARKWKFTLSNLELAFVQGEFMSGSLGGRIYTPLQDHDPTDNDPGAAGALVYTGMVEKDPVDESA